MFSFKPIKLSVLLLSLLVLVSCASLSYLGQSVSGQLEVLNKRVSIQEILDDPATPDPLSRKLKLALDARNFASHMLYLPDNDSYRSYSDLQRNYVVWNVFAASEFSLEPKQWCFIVVGCLSYRGYFAQGDAQAFAAGLRKQDYDVYIGGVPAYSTLGWFDDPVLNTMLNWEDADIVGLVFHELAHQKLYVKNDSAFNESFAVAVEQEGVRRWMNVHGSKKQYNDYLDNKKRQKEFVEMVLQTRDGLKKIYASNLSKQEKVDAKKQALADMLDSYKKIKANWNGYSGYDRWMNTELNNAKLSSVATYHQYVPAFQALLKQHDGNLKEFYAEVKKISLLSKEQRDTLLKDLGST